LTHCHELANFSYAHRIVRRLLSVRLHAFTFWLFTFWADLGPEESMPQSRVCFIGSRALHRDLPKVLETLENPGARFVLTIHGKPKAVLIGAEAFLEIMRHPSTEDRLLALQLGALVQGLESTSSTAETSEIDERQGALVGV
jgi:PHD/YefM family antitoxin component YafN of YafNO toxin-antitoxin module